MCNLYSMTKGQQLKRGDLVCSSFEKIASFRLLMWNAFRATNVE